MKKANGKNIKTDTYVQRGKKEIGEGSMHAGKSETRRKRTRTRQNKIEHNRTTDERVQGKTTGKGKCVTPKNAEKHERKKRRKYGKYIF